MKTLELPPSGPAPSPSEIRPGLRQGGTSESSLLGQPTKRGHYRGNRPFDFIVTLYADAQPAPRGVEEIQYGFPDAKLDPNSLDRVREIAACPAVRWQASARVLVRCPTGVKRLGLVVDRISVLAGPEPATAVNRVRKRRSTHALCIESFVKGLTSVEVGSDERVRRHQGLR